VGFPIFSQDIRTSRMPKLFRMLTAPPLTFTPPRCSLIKGIPDLYGSFCLGHMSPFFLAAWLAIRINACAAVVLNYQLSWAYNCRYVYSLSIARCYFKRLLCVWIWPSELTPPCVRSHYALLASWLRPVLNRPSSRRAFLTRLHWGFSVSSPCLDDT